MRNEPMPDGPGTVSASRTVPPFVPSLHQGSRPLVPSSAVKNDKPRLEAKSAGLLPLLVVARSKRVPVVVPSLQQGRDSWPLSTTKSAPLPTGKNLRAFEPVVPGTMSATGAVPPGVPLVSHGSAPRPPTSAVNHRLLPMAPNAENVVEGLPKLKSATSDQLIGWPFVRHSSRPRVGSKAVK